MSNATIVSNLETLLAAVEAQPETNFALNYFRRDEPCGTLFCTVGLACTMPKFQEMGFSLEARRSSIAPGGLGYHAKIDGESVMFGNRTDFAFGTNSYERVFEVANDGSLDEALGYTYNFEDGEANMTDKELAVARLKKQIELMKGEAA